MKKAFVFLMALLVLTNCEKISDNEIVELSNQQLKVAEVQSEVVYSYQGNNFNLFSSGSNILSPEPDPLYTSYTTSDFVTVVITFEEPLPGNLNLQDVKNLNGYSLTISDGHQVMTVDPGSGEEVLLSTDTDGNIIAPWSVISVCCLFPNNHIATLNWPGVRGIGDTGYLTCPNGSYPDTPRDGGVNVNSPGEWTSDIFTPEELTANLIVDIQDLVEVELNTGQANGLSRPLINAMRSISKGHIPAACSQLSDFIDEVNAKTPPLSEETAAELINEATAIMVALGC